MASSSLIRSIFPTSIAKADYYTSVDNKREPEDDFKQQIKDDRRKRKNPERGPLRRRMRGQSEGNIRGLFSFARKGRVYSRSPCHLHQTPWEDNTSQYKASSIPGIHFLSKNIQNKPLQGKPSFISTNIITKNRDSIWPIWIGLHMKANKTAKAAWIPMHFQIISLNEYLAQ